MPTSGSCAASSWRNGTYGNSPIYVLVSIYVSEITDGAYPDPMKEDDRLLGLRPVRPVPVAKVRMRRAVPKGTENASWEATEPSMEGIMFEAVEGEV